MELFTSSKEFEESLRRLDKKMSVTAGAFTKVPCDLAHWQKVAAEKYPHGLPKPFSSDSTQWLFNGNPAGADQPLQVAVARLLGYRSGRARPAPVFPIARHSVRMVWKGCRMTTASSAFPAVRGERPAHEQVLQMLQAAVER